VGKKEESEEPEAARSRSGESNRLGDVAEDIGESLGNLLNQVEGRWSSVRGQRDAVIKNLRAIRDKANALLAEAGDIQFPIPGVLKRRKSKSKGEETVGAAVPPSVKRGRGKASTKKAGASAEARAAAAAAQTPTSVKRARKGRRGDKVRNG
jgi:hypothetical protein